MSNARKLTVRQIVTLHHGLPVLDGHVETTVVENPKTGDKTTTTKLTPYKFGPEGKGGKVRWNITKDKSIVSSENDVFNKTRDALITEISGGTDRIREDDAEAIGRLNRETAALLDTVVEVSGLLDIDLADLNLDENPELTPSALLPLMPLIKE